MFHCPYCDGWEVRDEPLAVYGRGDEKGGGLALEMTLWSRDVVLCTDGAAELSTHCRERLARCGISLREERIARLSPRKGGAAGLVVAFEHGAVLERRALFFNTAAVDRSRAASGLRSL